MVKFAVEFWWKMLLTIFPSKRGTKISFQTSPEVRRKLRQLHSGNHWCLHFKAQLPQKRRNRKPHGGTILAAQCEIPPHTAQYLFEIVSQRGVSHAFCLVFIGYHASIAEIPLFRGVSNLHFACSARVKRSEKGREYRTQLAMLRHQKTP